MRDTYPYCFLIGDDSIDFIELCSSLRFSTHCKFIVLSQNPVFDMQPYMHMEWRNLANFSANKISTNERVFAISCIEGSVNLKAFHSLDDFQGFIIEVRKDILKNITSVKQTVVPENIQTFIQDFQNFVMPTLKPKYFEKLYADFLFDYEGQIQFLGSMISNTQNIPQYNNEYIHKECQKYVFDNAPNSNLKNKTLSVHIHTKSSKHIEIEYKMNQITSSWKKYRAIGINIPLILVQNFYERKIKTFYFIDPNDINLGLNQNAITYKFDFDVIYFDLDETLIWEWETLKEGVALVRHYHERKDITLKLITRHTFSISDTLEKIGLNTNYFDKIISVSPKQKKSDFFKKNENAIFIDNEFPERLNVRSHHQIPVLDLDQIEFLKD